MKLTRTLAAFCLLAVATAAGAQETGGVTGADFLIAPPLARVDAMGGVTDPLGAALDGMYMNPATIANLESMLVQVTLVPLPNDVLDTQIAVGFPLFGGYGGAAAQLLNTGGFTFVNESGQPQDTTNVFDAAVALSYARNVWSHLAVGANLKVIYRTLGTYSAFAGGGDVSSQILFETPHIGQAPKPPLRSQFAAELVSTNAQLAGEKDRRMREATRASTDAQKAVTDAERAVAELDSQIAKTEEAKRGELTARREAAQAKLEELRGRLTGSQADEQKALEGIEAWHEAEKQKAQAVHDGKVKDLEWVETERARLFEVIAEPGKELTNETLDANIDSTIAKTQDLLKDRTEAIGKDRTASEQKIQDRIAETEKSIEGYQTQITQAAGPRLKQLGDELDALKARKAELEGQAKSDAVNKEIQGLNGQISAKEKELAAAAADPWVKRLQDRIQQKRKDIEAMKADMAARATTADKTVAMAQATAARDVKAFEDLRVVLKRDLKKAVLKRDLAVLEAGPSTSAAEGPRNEFAATQKQLYLRLLAAMYKHEEQLFQSRLSTLVDDRTSRRQDFDASQEKESVTQEDDYAFQQRQLSAKISEMSANVPKGAPESDELKALRAQAVQLDASAADARKKFVTVETEFNAKEKALYDTESAAILGERARVRLVYLQTDTPYQNTAFSLGVRNVGTPVQFVSTPYPLPTTAFATLSYAPLNIEGHNVKLAAEFDYPFFESWSLGIGVEYVLADLAYFRAGYNVNELMNPLSAVSAGFGVHFVAGFTRYAVDYAFKPLGDYGFQHSISVSIGF